MPSATVETVLGRIAATELGPTSMHEHLTIDLSPWLLPPQSVAENAFASAPVSLATHGALQRDPIHMNRDNAILNDRSLAISELKLAHAAGTRTVVDLTTRGLRPDFSAIQEVSRGSGVQVVAGTGFYIHASHPGPVHDMDVSQLQDTMLRDVLEGQGESGVRAGAIGEIGTSSEVLPCELRVLRAAARLQRQTDLCMTIHTFPWTQRALEILDVLERDGADLAKVVIAHLDSGPIDLRFQRQVLARGAVISYDGFGKEWYVDRDRCWFPRDTERGEAIRTLVNEGWERSLVLATDACVKIQLTAFGGWGYQHLLGNIAPLLEGLGLTRQLVDQMLVGNPARLLASSID